MASAQDQGAPTRGKRKSRRPPGFREPPALLLGGVRLDRPDVFGLGTLLSLTDLEFHPLALFQCPVPG